MHFEKTLDNKEIFHGRVFDVIEQTVLLEDDRTAKREIVRHNGGAVIVAIDELHNVYMVRQFRKPIDMETLELPAGKLEKGEDPYLCAIRELAEETGVKADKMDSLGYVLTTPGFCDEKLYLYLATDLVKGSSNPDHDEFLSCEKIPLAKCVEKVERGEITDSKSIIGILRTARIYGF